MYQAISFQKGVIFLPQCAMCLHVFLGLTKRYSNHSEVITDAFMQKKWLQVM